MSTKPNAICETIAAKRLKNYQQALEAHDVEHKYIIAGPSKEVVLIGKSIVEVQVKREEKRKAQKHSPTIISPSITTRPNVTEKKRSTSNSETPQDWGRIFGEQKLLYMKQMQSSKCHKFIESKEIKKKEKEGINKNEKNVQKQRKTEYNHINKHVGAVSLKKGYPQKKSQEHLKTPCCNENSTLSSPVNNSIPSVIVMDRAIQCPEISDDFNKFDKFNPVRTLNFLMQELQDLVNKDKRTNEIFAEMQQILSKMSISPKKPLFEDLETIVIHSKLEASAVQLKELNDQVKDAFQLRISEQEALQSQIHKQDARLKEAKQKQIDLENHVKLLTQQLEEAIQAARGNEEIIATLKQQIKHNCSSEKIVSDLKTKLDKQTELARKKHIEVQYLMMEKDKLSVLSSYKDTLIAETRNIMKEFQNHSMIQLTDFNEAFINKESINSQMHSQVIHTGHACSSPTSNISDSSDIPISLHDLSDISLSMAEHVPQQHAIPGEDPNIKDSTHLEFVSLPDGESSHIMLDSYKIQANNDKEAIAQCNNKDNPVLHQNVSANGTNANKLLHHPSLKKDHNKENNFNSKKFAGFKRKQNEHNKNSFHHNALKVLESTVPKKPIDSNMKEKVQSMLDNIETRIPVNVPSPMRDYPHPDWSDSSLPSISTASELDIVPSNDN